MTPFESYCTYIGLKQHFNSKNYDFVKYHGKVKAKRESFDKRKDRFFFEKLAKHEDPKSFLLANFLKNPKGWIRQLSYGEEAKNNYEEWLKKIQSITYIVKTDISKMDETFDENFKVIDGQHPKIVKLYLGGDISLETLVILSDMVGCIRYWDKNLESDPVWEEISIKIKKYSPFLHYDMEKVRKLCLDFFTI
jgi:hypothetical protein